VLGLIWNRPRLSWSPPSPSWGNVAELENALALDSIRRVDSVKAAIKATVTPSRPTPSVLPPMRMIVAA
jgi:hypothetical protein